MCDHETLEALRQLLGPKGFTDDPQDMAPWTTDWRGRFHGRAAAMLSPADRGQVVGIVKLAAAKHIPIVPQGGNSGMVAGATPDDSGKALLLRLGRMNRIKPVGDGGLVRCQAGVILQDLHDAVARQGRRFPLTLGGKGSATVGGLVSTNAGGTQVLRHGVMRHLVAGLAAVLPDGSVYDAMTPLKKDNRGYDLKHLLIGGEGTLGIVTDVLLQTVPALIDRCVIWAGVDSPASAYRLLLFMQDNAREQLEGFEILPDSALQAVLRHIDGTRPPIAAGPKWHVLMEIVKDDAGQRAPADRAAELMEQALVAGLIEDATLASSEAQAEAFWKIRDSISEAERADGPALQHDISVPVADMARFIETESPQIEAAYPGTRVVAFGHMGDGNVHYHVKAPDGIDPGTWYDGPGRTITAHVYDRVASYGGSLSAEHGIGQAKIAEFARLSDAVRINILRNVKSAIDPHGIMNPGKLVPLA